jgi:hypothetical protein
MLKKALTHEGVRGSGGVTPLFLTTALFGGEWSALPVRFTSRPSPPGYKLDRRLGGPRARQPVASNNVIRQLLCGCIALCILSCISPALRAALPRTGTNRCYAHRLHVSTRR